VQGERLDFFVFSIIESMPILYTGKGDRGKSVVGKRKIDKNNLVIEVLGDLDQLNSLCGLVKARMKDRRLKRTLHDVQEALFIVQANLAYLMYPKFKPPVFMTARVEALETIIDGIEKRIEVRRAFVIPGSNEESAWLDYLRTVAREIERSVLRLSKQKSFGKLKARKEILAYLNRLSSLFFALARHTAKRKRIREPSPTYR